MLKACLVKNWSLPLIPKCSLWVNVTFAAKILAIFVGKQFLKMLTGNVAFVTALAILVGGCSSPEAEAEARYEYFMGESIDLSEVEAPYHEFFSEPRNLEDYKIARNFLDVQSSGKVDIEILRLMCQPIEVHAAESGLPIRWYAITFSETRTMCLLILGISNNSDAIRQVYPDDGIPGEVDPSQGAVWLETAAGEIIEALSFAGAPKVDFTRGAINPGTQVVTAFWIETDIEWDEIAGISYTAGAPLDENQVPVGDGYDFEIDLTDWEYVPLPEELEPFFAEWSVQP